MTDFEYKPPQVRDHLTPEGQREYDEHQKRMEKITHAEIVTEALHPWPRRDGKMTLYDVKRLAKFRNSGIFHKLVKEILDDSLADNKGFGLYQPTKQ